jgi:hypothetical protein
MRRSILVVALAMLAVIQAVPYGVNHTNPPVRVGPPWDSERTRHLAGRLCFDCHSNETAWPWFSHVAPISWLIQRDMCQVGRTWLAGDGHVFVLPVSAAIRIRTGERGEDLLC